MKMWITLTYLLLALSICRLVTAGEVCYNTDKAPKYFFTCDTGCCDSPLKQTCCSGEIPVWLIVLAIIGGIVALVIGLCIGYSVLTHRGLSLFKTTEATDRPQNPSSIYTYTQSTQTVSEVGSTFMTTQPESNFTQPPAYSEQPPPYFPGNNAIPFQTKI